MAGKRNASKGEPPEAEPRDPYDDWVWWPNQVGRRSRAKEEFFEFPQPVQGEFASCIYRFLHGISRPGDFKELRFGVKELRVKMRGQHYRVLFFVTNRVCVGLTCFEKDQRTTGTHLDRAVERMRTHKGP